MQIAMLLSRPGRLRNVLATLAVTTLTAAFVAAAVLNDHPMLDDEPMASSTDPATAAAAHRHAPLAETASGSIAAKPDATLPGADESHAAGAE